MAMQIASGEVRQHGINVTPLIDVLLVLIIIFMVIQPLHPDGFPAVAPQPNKSNSSEPTRSIVVQVLDANASGVRINGLDVTWESLRAHLGGIYRTRAEKVLFVTADKDIDFASLARVMDIARGVDPSIQVGVLTPKMLRGE